MPQPHRLPPPPRSAGPRQSKSRPLSRTAARIPTGIAGFDALTRGGLPRGKLTVVSGAPGCGKSVFALQALAHAARQGERTVYVCFEEGPEEAQANLRSFAWDLPRNLSQLVHFVDGDLGPDVVSVGRFDIAGLLASLEAHCRQLDASWVIFDGLDALMSILADPLLERREIYRLKRWIRGMQVGGLITVKNLGGTSLLDMCQMDGVLAFAADCVVHLSATVRERALIRTLRVVKYRGAINLGGEFPFVLDERGITVGYLEPKPPAAAKMAWERVSSGVGRLDALLQGGYLRGSSILISGEPGTAKTTLAAAFAAAGASRGERVLMVSFDEDAARSRRNLTSVGLDLEKPLREGRLLMLSLSASLVSPEAHYVHVMDLLRTSGARHLVIDPVTALSKSADPQVGSASVVERLLEYTRSEGITTILTALQAANERPGPSPVNVSTLADTWITLTYNVSRGERNRALSIVKSRGMNHSNQVRELVLGPQGPDLADVYTQAGEVLMGTARLEQERTAADAEAQARRAHEVRRRQLIGEIAAVEERLGGLRREIDSRRAELSALSCGEQLRQEEGEGMHALIARSRRADRIPQRAPRRTKAQG